MRRIALSVFAFGLIAAGSDLAAEQQEKDDLCAVLDSIPMEKLRDNFKHHKNPEEKIKMLLEGPGREDGCRRSYWHAFDAKPAGDVLGPADFRTYQEALDRSDCDTAFALLINAFPAAHPRAPNILDEDVHREGWIASVLPDYAELEYCLAIRKLKEARAEIERRGIVVDRRKALSSVRRRFISCVFRSISI